MVSGVLFSLAFGVVYRIRQASGASPDL